MKTVRVLLLPSISTCQRVSVPAFLALTLALSAPASAQDQTVTGNLTVTGNATVSQLITTGGAVTGDSTGLTINAVGTNQSITLTPTGIGTVWVNGNASVQGYLGVPGGILSGRHDLLLSAGGSNQNVVITPTGTGRTIVNGNVGIGTTTPSFKLSFGNAASGHELALYESNGANFYGLGIISGGMSLYADNAQALTVVGGGNVGIGTNAPTTRLDVAGNAAISGSLTVGGTLSAANLTLAGQAFNPSAYLPQSGGAISGSLSATTLTATQGTVTGGTSGLTLSAGGADQNITFTPSGTGSTILNGRVGIGTSTPTAKLDVVGSASISGNMTVGGTFTGNSFTSTGNIGIGTVAPSFKLSFGNAASGHELALYESNGANFYGLGIISGGMSLYADNAQALTVVGGGNVGIGTNAPTTRLDVAGNAAISGSLTVGGTFTAANFASSGLTGGNAGLALSAGGTDQNVTITPSGSGSTIINGNATVQNSLTVTGNISGGTAGLALTAGGTNQNVTITPSGTGNTILNGNVGIGTTSPSALLTVGQMGNGDHGQFQFYDRPNSYTNSATLGTINAQSVVQAAATSAVSSDSTTALLLNNQATTAGSASGLVIDTNDPSTNGTDITALRGMYSSAQHLGTGTAGTIAGVVGFAKNAGNATTVVGVRAVPVNVALGSTTVTATNVTGFDAIFSNTGGVITTYKGVNAGNVINSGTITNTYGVYIGNLTSGTQTNKPFSVYASDANALNYFAGNVGIGTATPTQTLDVAGNAAISGNLTVGGTFTAANFGGGAVTGGTSGLALNAGGTNQNITLTPSGTGATVINGNVGVGTANPSAKLDVAGVVRNQGVQITTLANATILGTDASGNLVAASATSLAPTSSQVTTALGYTPANKAGDTLTGNLKLAAGTATVAPLTLQSGASLTTPVFGSVEFDGTNVFVTNNETTPTRKALAYSATTLAGYGIADPVVLTSGSYADPVWIASLTAAKLTGTLAPAVLPAFTGDVTSSAGSTTLTLANSGVTAGTYAKVTVDAKGRVTAGASLASGDVTGALGYAPYNSTNPSGYITAAGAPVQSVFGRTGNVTLASSDVTNALTYTPANKAGDMFTGAIAATTVTAIGGTISGGSTGLTLNAGGTNQNVAISPSGTGVTTINGNVGIGTTDLRYGAQLTVKNTSSQQNFLTGETSDFSANSAGTQVNIGLGATGGNTYGVLNTLSGGGVTWNNLVLQSGGGNVGIGTTNPTSKLTVSSSGVDGTYQDILAGLYSANDTEKNSIQTAVSTIPSLSGFQFQVSNGAGSSGQTLGYRMNRDSHHFYVSGSETLTIAANGNVGVGTTSPTAKLDIVGDAKISGSLSAATLNIGGTVFSPSSFVTKTGNDSITASTFVASGGSISGGSAGLTFTPGATNKSIVLTHDNPDGTAGAGRVEVRDTLAITNVAGIQYLLMGNQDSSGANHPAILRSANGTFELGSGDSWTGQGGNFTSKLTLLDNGNVGIATATPLGKLGIDAGAGATSSLPGIALGGMYEGSLYTNGGIRANGFQQVSGPYSGGVSLQRYWYDGNAYGFQDVLNVTGAGNVGIGTTNPGANLAIGDGTGSRRVAIAGAGAADNMLSIDNQSVAGMAVGFNNSGAGNVYGIPSGGAYLGLAQSFPLYFSTAATPRMTIATAGNVGIGTTSPAAKLDIRTGTPGEIGYFLGSGSDGAIIGTAASPRHAYLGSGNGSTGLSLGINGDSNALYIDNTGNVGIGTTSPQRTLHVAATGSVFTLESNTGTANNKKWDWDFGNGNTLNFRAVDDAYSTASTYESVTRSGASISAVTFPNGNVGIGTTTPAAKLDVAGNVNVSGNLMVGGTFSAAGYAASNGTISGGTTGLALNAGGTNQNVTITPSGTGATVLNGNVGIGTVNPGASLEAVSNTSGAGGWYMAGQFTAANYPMVRFNASVPGKYSSIGNNGDGSLQFLVNGSSGSVGTTAAVISATGNVGIGATDPGIYKLAVNGTIHTKEVVVDQTGWADDVFDPSYRNAPLSEVEQHIKEHGHLPGVPSAQAVAEKGVGVGEMQATLLRKVEEMTLHLIAQEKRMAALEKENAELRARVMAVEGTK